MLAKKILKRVLASMGFTISRAGSANGSAALGYIPAKTTIASAERAGLSVCDYVENLWSQQGCTQRVIESMASLDAFAVPNPRVLEIGAGTGRYLEKVLGACKPVKYESYETARDWAEWLQSRYPIFSRDADGTTLNDTPDKSVDLLHAHGVFVYLPFLNMYGYWNEIFRVTCTGGTVVFDICSEDCFDEPSVKRWLASKDRYPSFTSSSYVISVFAKHGFSLLGKFMNQYGHGQSEYLVFRRDQ